jgi:hypothetical protein
MSKCKPLTKKESEWIDDFRKLAKRCPKKLWLFSASGTMCVMKFPEDGETNLKNGAVNQENLVGTISITNDGGDW